MRALVSALAVAVLLLAAGAEADQAQGKQLFEEGKAAMAQKDFATACARFEASYAASSVPGALLSWADCEEARGRLATSLQLWQRGAAIVGEDADRAAFVRARIAALDVRVPKVTVKVPPIVEFAKARVDGREIEIGTAVALDPGVHEITAEAPGHPADRVAVELSPGMRLSVEVFTARPPAVPAPPPTPEPGDRPADGPSEPDATLVTAGWIVGGVGIASAIGFGVTGGLLLDTCHGTLDPCGGAEGRDAEKALALTRSNMALGVLGLAALGTGAVLLAVGYTSGSAKAEARADVRVGLGHISVGGSF